MKNKILIVEHGDIGAIAAHLRKLHAQGIEIKTYEELDEESREYLDHITSKEIRNVGDYADRVNEIINIKYKEMEALTSNMHNYAETMVRDQFPWKKGGKKNKRNNWNRR